MVWSEVLLPERLSLIIGWQNAILALAEMIEKLVSRGLRVHVNTRHVRNAKCGEKSSAASGVCASVAFASVPGRSAGSRGGNRDAFSSVN